MIMRYHFSSNTCLHLKTTFLIIALIKLSIISAEPWGKDADLAVGQIQPSRPRTFLGENLIRFHKQVISPADGPRSHHKPNSSQYTIDAMRKYGFFQGYLMGCDRLMRENEDPWIYKTIKDDKGETFKWDPVK
jgi:uncharacterized protein